MSTPDRLRAILERIVQEHTSGWFEEGGIQALLGVIADERKDAARKERERCADRTYAHACTIGTDMALRYGPIFSGMIRALPDEEKP